jgi:hypothetical protein
MGFSGRVVPLLSLALAFVLSPAAGADASSPGHSSPARLADAGPRMVLPFVQDDYTRALAEARARKVPLFIEAWAPW